MKGYRGKELRDFGIIILEEVFGDFFKKMLCILYYKFFVLLYLESIQ